MRKIGLWAVNATLSPKTNMRVLTRKLAPTSAMEGHLMIKCT